MIHAVFGAAIMLAADLPMGSAPTPVPVPHFPDRLHAVVWRNWQLVPADRIGKVVGATREQILAMGRAMGLSGPPRITADQQRRSYITVIRRNWHLLPYDQLLELLGWDEARLAYALREDDFLFAKLGGLKPKCERVVYRPPDESAQRREAKIAGVVRRYFPGGVGLTKEPLFGFVRELSRPPGPQSSGKAPVQALSDSGGESMGRVRGVESAPLRLCYSYFALYGDPLMEKDADPYPDGYLARLSAVGVNGVWLQGVLYKLAPFPWQPELSAGYEQRLTNLRRLVARAAKHGIRVYLYLNEPRAMPLSFFDQHPDLKGATEGDHAALCTSVPEVRKYLTDSVESICRAAPALGGFFTITASENLSNCWSHYGGAGCPRCSKRPAAEVVAEVVGAFHAGIRQAGTRANLIAWDWGWPEDWAEPIIARLPQDAWFMSVSEWSLPIERGGVKSEVGEYSLSSIGPGPRALRNWELARKRGIRCVAKIQAAESWELSAVPYVPALANTAQHAANLRAAGVDDLMLGWTLGGYPSANLQAVGGADGERASGTDMTVAGVPAAAAPVPPLMVAIAENRFGHTLAPAVAKAWQDFSTAFREFPFHVGVVYTAPLQTGPANLLWESPTGYAASMVGIPYDDLNSWRAIYPPDVFSAQLEKVADGFETTIDDLRRAGGPVGAAAQQDGSPDRWITHSPALSDLLRVAAACAIHFQAVANQVRFVMARDALAKVRTGLEARPLLEELGRLLDQETDLARRLYAIQVHDSRIGFEASNQYYYVPLDLVEKVLDCQDLHDRWLADQTRRWKSP